MLKKMKVAAIAVTLLVSCLNAWPTYTFGEAKVIEDPALEKAIKKELKLEERELVKDDLLKLTSLFPQSSGDKIKSLQGLQAAKNLERLYLPKQEITDLTPLSSLTKLKMLAVDNNQIENICSISGLNQLDRLVISNNNLTE